MRRSVPRRLRHGGIVHGHAVGREKRDTLNDRPRTFALPFGNAKVQERVRGDYQENVGVEREAARASHTAARAAIVVAIPLALACLLASAGCGDATSRRRAGGRSCQHDHAAELGFTAGHGSERCR